MTFKAGSFVIQQSASDQLLFGYQKIFPDRWSHPVLNVGSQESILFTGLKIKTFSRIIARCHQKLLLCQDRRLNTRHRQLNVTAGFFSPDTGSISVSFKRSPICFLANKTVCVGIGFFNVETHCLWQRLSLQASSWNPVTPITPPSRTSGVFFR